MRLYCYHNPTSILIWCVPSLLYAVNYIYLVSYLMAVLVSCSCPLYAASYYLRFLLYGFMLFVGNIGWRQFVAYIMFMHVYIVVDCTEKGGISMYHYRRYMYVYMVIGSAKKGGVSMCCYHWYRCILSPATVYADDNPCNNVLSPATIYAVTVTPWPR